MLASSEQMHSCCSLDLVFLYGVFNHYFFAQKKTMLGHITVWCPCALNMLSLTVILSIIFEKFLTLSSEQVFKVYGDSYPHRLMIVI